MRKVISSLMLVGTLTSCTNTQNISTVVEEKQEIKIDFIVINDILYWKGNDEKLNFIYDLSLLKGKDGKDGKDGVDGKDATSSTKTSQGSFSGGGGIYGGIINSTGSVGPQGPAGPQGLPGQQGPQGPAGLDGIDGKSIEIRYNNNNNSVEWRYLSDLNWTKLFEISNIPIPSVTTVFAPEFRSTETHFQMRMTSSDQWQSIFEFPIYRPPEPQQPQIVLAPKTLEQIIAEVKESVVQVTREGGNGSGVLYKKNGNTYQLITNAHVVQNITDLQITFNRYGNFYDVSNVNLIGKDPSTDIAILSFETNFNLPIVEIADSNLLQVGSSIFTIGNPSPIGTLYSTVTQGIISGTNRRINSGAIINNYYLQHSAAISPGNSGGPVFNEGGQLIGINTLKARSYLDFENISLAVVSNIVERVVSELEDKQTLTNLPRAVFGADLFPNLSSCTLEYGACIKSVKDNTVSQLKGLQEYDVIVGFKNERMEDFVNVYNHNQLGELLVQTKIQELIQVKYYRNGELFTSETLTIRN
jgi:S1-C subfamily serine protease